MLFYDETLPRFSAILLLLFGIIVTLGFTCNHAVLFTINPSVWGKILVLVTVFLQQLQEFSGPGMTSATTSAQYGVNSIFFYMSVCI
jgi:hypothetical protein